MLSELHLKRCVNHVSIRFVDNSNGDSSDDDGVGRIHMFRLYRDYNRPVVPTASTTSTSTAASIIDGKPIVSREIVVSELEYVLLANDLVIRITKTWNGPNYIPNSLTVPANDMLHVHYNTNDGANPDVYCVAEPTGEGSMIYRNAANALNRDLAKEIRAFVGHKPVDTLLLRNQRIDLQIENLNGDVLYTLRKAFVEHVCRGIFYNFTRKKIFMACNSSLENYVNVVDSAFEWSVVLQHPVVEHVHPKSEVLCEINASHLEFGTVLSTEA
jgi:hypothetical protein